MMLSVLTLCSMFNTDDSGDLGGYWHLTRIDTLETGGITDIPESPVFYSVQGAILEVKNINTGVKIIFRYNHTDNRLYLTDARFNQREQGDPLITDVEELKPYGINKLEESFAIETLNGSHMVLRSEMLKLYFDKL